MIVRVGIDEAGLGPTLGPLAVAGFATQCRDDDGEAWGAIDDLRAGLGDQLRQPGGAGGGLEVGDSKKIHTGARKLARIERTALATVAWVYGQLPRTVGELLALVCVGGLERAGDRRAPWWAALDEPLPLANSAEELRSLAAGLRQAGERAGIAALWYRADLVAAARVNRELHAEQQREGTKNTWATHAVLRLLRAAVTELEGPALAIWCDKAGGRQAYEACVHRVFPELDRDQDPDQDRDQDRDQGGALFGADAVRLETLDEQRARSHYRIASAGRRVELGFVLGGDRVDPRISWASILAKYLRELIMRSFNRYFAGRIAGLRPTAGYPEDARRFIAEVEAALDGELGLDAAAWIRAK